MAKWLCEKPALLPGLENIKGKIQKGYDADLVVWDPEKSFIVTENMIHHRHKITPYLDEKLLWCGGSKHGLGEKKFLIMATSFI